MQPTESFFGHLPDGQKVKQWRLCDHHQEVIFSDFGARILAWRVRHLNGWRSLLHGDVDLNYLSSDGLYMGATIGRFANRIANARFYLNDELICLESNEGSNQLHGGPDGFAGQVWQACAVDHGLRFSHESKQGQSGFPGNLNVSVEYRLTAAGMEIQYQAETDADTVINMTNHAYFNLSDDLDILRHRLQIASAHYLPVTAEKIPVGELRAVDETAFDFRSGALVGEQMALSDPQLILCQGYDHCFVFTLGADYQVRLIGSDGLTLKLRTSEPALQFYSGNHLVPRYAALALETQHFPDSPNQPGFPSTILRAGDRFTSYTQYHLEREGS